MYNSFLLQISIGYIITRPRDIFSVVEGQIIFILYCGRLHLNENISARFLSLVEWRLQIGLFHTDQLQALLTYYKHSSKKLSWHYSILLNFHSTIIISCSLKKYNKELTLRVCAVKWLIKYQTCVSQNVGIHFADGHSVQWCIEWASTAVTNQRTSRLL